MHARTRTRSPREVAFIVGAAALPFAAGLVLDDVVDPLLIWGGRVCRGGHPIDAQCQVPPFLLLTSVVVSIELASWWLRRHR